MARTAPQTAAPASSTQNLRKRIISARNYKKPERARSFVMLWSTATEYMQTSMLSNSVLFWKCRCCAEQFHVLTKRGVDLLLQRLSRRRCRRTRLPNPFPFLIRNHHHHYPHNHNITITIIVVIVINTIITSLINPGNHENTFFNMFFVTFSI